MSLFLFSTGWLRSFNGEKTITNPFFPPKWTSFCPNLVGMFSTSAARLDKLGLPVLTHPFLTCVKISWGLTFIQYQTQPSIPLLGCKSHYILIIFILIVVGCMSPCFRVNQPCSIFTRPRIIMLLYFPTPAPCIMMLTINIAIWG